MKNWKLVRFERFNTLSEARREEIRIKKGKSFARLTGRSAVG